MRNLKIICAAVVLATGIAQANVTNGGFETGDFTGWSTLGSELWQSTSIETAAFGTGPTEGTYQASIMNVGVYVAEDHLYDFETTYFGLTPGTLDGLLPSAASEPAWGSGIKQDITAEAGQTVVFDWNFLTQELDPDNVEYSSLIHRDFAFVAIDGTATLLADTESPLFGPSPVIVNDPGFGFDIYETGFHTFAYTFTTSGTHSLGFGAINLQDDAVGSYLMVDGVRIIPAPSALLLGSVGVSLVTWLRRRRTL